MLLRDALQISGPALVAAVGAGGKTTLLQRLAAELAAGGSCVVSTTTTAIWQPEQGPLALAAGDDLLAAVAAQVGPGRIVIAAAESRLVEQDDGLPLRPKLQGVALHLPARLLALAGVSHVVVEADGARGRAIKAPAAHEPVIPPQATHVLAVVGIDALGEPLDGAIAHRPERIASLLGLAEGGPLAPRHIAALLAHAAGGRKSVPATAHFYPFINKVQDEETLRGARAIAAHLRGQPGVQAVLIGAALAAQPVLEVWR